jgi:hypothetical protein
MVPSVDERHAEKAQAERRKMSDSYRHHVATRREIVFIEVPVAGPDFGRQVKPRYGKQDRPQPWRPQRDIPAKPNKAEALRRFLERVNRQNEEVRAFMAEARRRAA